MRAPTALPPNLLGASLLTGAWVFFTAEMVLVRILSEHLSVAQIVVFRLGTQAVIFVPILVASAGRVARTQHIGLHGLRALFSAVGMVLFYLAFSLLPLAMVTTLTFTQAAFMIVLAAVFLGEIISRRRIVAVVGGFVGVLVVMRPGFGGFQPAMLVALLGALVSAGLMIITRKLSMTEARMTVMFYSASLGLILMALPAALTWQPIAPEHWAYLAAIGLAGTTGQFMMIGAFQVSEASALAPVDYVRLIFAVAAGYMVFAEVPDVWTFVGSAIVVVSVASIATSGGSQERLARNGQTGSERSVR
ncbi:MAG: DMT family transporter [Devosia sp.]